MVINKKKNENKVGTYRPCNCKKKMFSTIQYLFDWTHMRHGSVEISWGIICYLS